ncbi:MAG: pyridine nucleotide-disulfide oxidoreductase [Phenylobacterium sp.]|nr:MAG: pyridine nucleotide-disulfide oxidoreductase [Phenylobacterium sp.]
MADRRGAARTVAVVGGGFSGLLTAIHLLERDPAVIVRLVERAPRFGRGRAYAVGNPDHLLNVRAANMSAFPDRPGEFQAWLAAQGEDAGPDAFVSRRRYGDYLQGLLRTAMRGPGARGRLLLEQDEAVAVVPDDDDAGGGGGGGGYQVRLSVGRSFRADAVVLAVGFGPPGRPAFAPPDILSRRDYVGDPWRGDLAGLPEGEILLIGSGLTMIDVLLSLDRPGREFTVLSRHGLLPQTHASAATVAPPEGPMETPRRALRTLRAHARAVGWRSAVDSIRPATTAIWRSWPEAEQRRFLRHLRARWDVHRHRMAPWVASQLGAAIWGERLEILAGRILRLEPCEGGFEATLRPRGQRHPITRLFRAVVNCMGPTGDLPSNPLLADLLARGLAHPDALRLGLAVDAAGRLTGGGDAPSPGLYAVGPLTRGAFWEAVAVPDLRLRTASLARVVLADLAAKPA